MMSRLTPLVLFAALTGASAPLASPPADPSNLTVHEWGTFTTIAGDDGRPVEWSAWAGPQDLPCFVEKLKWCAKCTPGATVRMETPVLYFYGPQPAKLDVSVKFRQGLLTEWYPRAAASPDTIPQSGLSRPFTHSLRWSAVDVTPGAAEHFPTEPAKNHYYAARETDAAPLRVGSQQEKFLFYRGIGRFEIPIVATTPDSTRVVVKNTGSEPLAAVVLFENRGGRIGYRISHGVTGERTFATPALNSGLDQLTGELERVLVAQGLYRARGPRHDRDLAGLVVRGGDAPLLHRAAAAGGPRPAAADRPGAGRALAGLRGPRRAVHGRDARRRQPRDRVERSGRRRQIRPLRAGNHESSLPGGDHLSRRTLAGRPGAAAGICLAGARGFVRLTVADVLGTLDSYQKVNARWADYCPPRVSSTASRMMATSTATASHVVCATLFSISLSPPILA